MSNIPISIFGDPARIWTVPAEDVSRQATASLRGYVYQLHASASAWIGLGPKDQLYLEVAEDYAELLRDPHAVDEVLKTTQVKDTRESGNVTLNSSDVLSAIESLYRLKKSNPGREIRFVFLTTSSIGQERTNALPSGLAGLIAWERATSGDGVEDVRAALLQRKLSDDLRAFVADSAIEDLRANLIAPLTFACGAADWRRLEESNRQALVALRDEVQATEEMAYRAYDAVFREVIACAIGPKPRCLNRDQLLSHLARSTSIPVPSSIAIRQFSSYAERPIGPMPSEELRDLANGLIEASAPPSVDLLFPDAAAAVKDALKATFSVEPLLTSVHTDNLSVKSTFSELVKHSERMHLVMGQPGAGKTQALWRAAKRQLASGDIVPLYLPAGQAAGWNELEDLVREVAHEVNLANLFRDPRIIVFVDGWSEFAVDSQPGEKQRALRRLRNARVIATARFTDIDDACFRQWNLELLPPDRVVGALTAAAPGDQLPPRIVQDLLRIPLLLSIYVLAGGPATATGDLLRQFHAHLARGLPERFTEVLAGAVADLFLTGTRSFGRLMHELHTRAAAAGVVDPIRLMRSLGVITERSGQAVPVHDLYWSWLAGFGLISEARAERAIGPLRTRESYMLAIQSGVRASESDVSTALRSDLVLAALLDGSRDPERPSSIVRAVLNQALNDSRLAVRNRAALAALEGEWPEFLQPALDVLSELGNANLSSADWKQGLRPARLYTQRATLAEWFGSPNTDLVLDVIAEKGGSEWSPWLEQVAASGRISWADASAAALCCCRDIPPWTQRYLDDVIASRFWKLRSAAERRSNVPLARYVATQYERLIQEILPPSSSAWMVLNRLLVSCGDEGVFSQLLNAFPSMGVRAQELIGYAVVERGEAWVARFQREAFKTGARHHHRLAEQVSLDIDDQTARDWIAAGHDEAGWRVLITRYGETLLSELIAQLPSSFAGLHHIPALAYMRWLPSAPESLIAELWSRVGSPMQPKAMQDLLDATARVYPVGVPHIIRYVAEHPGALPAYHLRHAILLYENWMKNFGAGLGIKTSNGIEYPFPEWAAVQSAISGWEDHFTPQMLALSPALAVDYVLHHLTDQDRAAAVLNELKGGITYNAVLLEYMLKTPTLTKLIPSVFAGCFDTFPLDAILQCLSTSNIDQDMLLYRLAAAANPMHRGAHELLIARVLDGPPNIHNFNYVASMLKGYSRKEVMLLVEAVPQVREDNWLWFIRVLEAARGERLVNEDGSVQQ